MKKKWSNKFIETILKSNWKNTPFKKENISLLTETIHLSLIPENKKLCKNSSKSHQNQRTVPNQTIFYLLMIVCSLRKEKNGKVTPSTNLQYGKNTGNSQQKCIKVLWLPYAKMTLKLSIDLWTREKIPFPLRLTTDHNRTGVQFIMQQCMQART